MLLLVVLRGYPRVSVYKFWVKGFGFCHNPGGFVKLLLKRDHMVTRYHMVTLTVLVLKS